MNYHLSATDISGWLAGDRTPEHERHMQECEDCRAALEQRERLLVHFGGAMREWSGRQLGQAHSIARPVEKPRHGFGILPLAAAALMLAVLAAVPIQLRHRAAERAAEAARQDETLLEQVQTEVARSVPQPMEPLTQLVSWTSDSTK